MTLPDDNPEIDVSVIVPAYNYDSYVDECLESIFMQEGPSLEVIVVDDGSTDNTRAVLEKYENRIKYIYQENRGLSAARNTGLKNSSGRYIQFLDADDLLGPGNLQSKFSCLENTAGEKALAICRNLKFSGRAGRFPDLFRGWYLYNENLEYHICRINLAPPHAYMLPRGLFNEVGLFDESMRGCEDYDLWLKAVGSGYRLLRCNQSHVCYRQHGKSMGAGKYRDGKLEYDVLVHKKKQTGEYGDCLTHLLQQPDGCIAFTDGLLHTALLIDSEANSQGLKELVEIALGQLDSYIADPGFRENIKSPVSRLYISRLFSKISRLRKRDLTGLCERLELLFRKSGGIRYITENLLYALPCLTYDDFAAAYHGVKTLKQINAF